MPNEKRQSVLKPIIKQSKHDEKRTTDVSKKSGFQNPETHRSSGYFHLGVPSFFGGPDGSQHKVRSLNSIHSHNSYHLDEHTHGTRPGNHVRFLDRLSIRSISALFIPSGDENDFDHHIIHLQEIQDDPYYLPGFVDLYYATDITIIENTCCCSIHASYKVEDEKSGRHIYSIEQETDGGFATCLKFCCFRNYDLMRIGFVIKVFNPAAETSTYKKKLLTFKRKTHWFADQLDIVETYYSIENSHVGRIEKTKDGFRLIDYRGVETYRVLRESKREEKCLTSVGTLIVFSCIDRKVVAKITFAKRKFFGRMCSMFMKSLKHTIRWSTEIGVAMKAMIMGVLFLELHSVEEYVDLPLGRDADRTPTTTKHRLNLLM